MTTDHHQAARFPRGRRTAPATVVAVLLVLIAAAAGYLAVMGALGRTITAVDLGTVRSHLAGTSWRAPEMLVIGIVVAALGVVLLLVALLPASRHLIELNNPDIHTAAAVPERGLRRTVQSAAVEIDGISAARARIGRRRVRLDLSTRLRHIHGLSRSAEIAVTQRLGELDLSRPRGVTTHLQQKDT